MSEEKIDKDLQLEFDIPVQVLWEEQVNGNLQFVCKYKMAKEPQLVFYQGAAQGLRGVIEANDKKPKKEQMSQKMRKQHSDAADLMETIAAKLAQMIYDEQIALPDNRIVVDTPKIIMP